MVETVEKQKNAMEKKVHQVEEASTRDRVKEQVEAAQRMQIQENKANAITKFENVLEKMVQHSLKRATLKSMHQIDRPMFNQDFIEYFMDDFSVDGERTPNGTEPLQERTERNCIERYQRLVARTQKKVIEAAPKIQFSEEKVMKSPKKRIKRRSPNAEEGEVVSPKGINPTKNIIIRRPTVSNQKRVNPLQRTMSNAQNNVSTFPPQKEDTLNKMRATIQNALQRRMFTAVSTR